MLLSIIVPVYNGNACIETCLNSIAYQLFQDFELIIINDGSTDNTGEIIERFIQEHPNMDVKLINKKNEGLPQARKTGVIFSQGEYVGFIDADDWIEPTYYQSLARSANKLSLDICWSGFIEERENNTSTRRPSSRELNTLMNGTEAFIALNKRTAVYPYAWNKIYKRELLLSINYPRGNPIGEDYAIMSQSIPHAARILAANETGYHYIHHKDSMTSAGFNDSYREGFVYYKNALYNLETTGKELTTHCRNYMVLEFMAIMAAMCRNNTFDQSMITWIHHYVKSNITHYCLLSRDALHLKLSAIVFAMNPHIFYFMYQSLINALKHSGMR